MSWYDWVNPMTYVKGGIEGAKQYGPMAVRDTRNLAKDGLESLDRTNNEWKDVDPNGNIAAQARVSSQFARLGEEGYANLGKDTGAVKDQLLGQMQGKNSVSAEQLRQGLQQNLAAQSSMAAGARPANAAMAARTAAMQAGRLGSGLAGQQAMAGIAERNAAAGQLGNFLSQQRQLELQAALQGRQNALAGYGGIENARTSRFSAAMGQPTSGERVLGFIQDGTKLAAMA